MALSFFKSNSDNYNDISIIINAIVWMDECLIVVWKNTYATKFF